jgi:hypothetical protein
MATADVLIIDGAASLPCGGAAASGEPGIDDDPVSLRVPESLAPPVAIVPASVPLCVGTVAGASGGSPASTAAPSMLADGEAEPHAATKRSGRGDQGLRIAWTVATDAGS